MDYVKDGSRLLTSVFDEYDFDEIKDLKVLDKFLARLLEVTNGMLIVDFLDSGNWDHFGSYSIDYENEIVFVNWHPYIGSPKIEDYINSLDYKPDIYSIMFKFQDLKFYKSKSFPFITIRGYALGQKEVMTYLKQFDQSVIQDKLSSTNFCAIYRLDRGLYTERCYCLHTPLYSVLLNPKDTAGSTVFSMKALFLFNYISCTERIQKIISSKDLPSTDTDVLSEKANTVRRIFEFALKIECSYHLHLNISLMSSTGYNANNFMLKNSYGNTLLGDLINKVKKLKSADELFNLNRIVVLSNEFSHDSGKKGTQENLDELIKLAVEYIRGLIKILKSP